MEIENTQEQKTFTQEEVNRIVGERLSKERSRSEADLVKRENDLKQRELEMSAREMLAEKGLPKELASVLKYSDTESMTAAVDTIHRLKSTETEGHKLKVIDGGMLPEGDHVFEDNTLEKAFRLE